MVGNCSSFKLLLLSILSRANATKRLVAASVAPALASLQDQPLSQAGSRYSDMVASVSLLTNEYLMQLMPPRSRLDNFLQLSLTLVDVSFPGQIWLDEVSGYTKSCAETCICHEVSSDSVSGSFIFLLYWHGLRTLIFALRAIISHSCMFSLDWYQALHVRHVFLHP